MLEAKIIKRFPGFTLDVEFDTSGGGAVLGLLGASGCGKSLTLQCLAGLTRPDEGHIALNGRVLFDSLKKINLPPQNRSIGYLFQHYSLFPNMTVMQNIMCAIPASRREKHGRAMKLIAAMRLEGSEHKRPAELSGGQRQRAALARMLAAKPEAILLDEPFSALDGYLRWELELELSDTLREFGGPSVFVSHSRDEAYRLCSEICVLDNGKGQAQRSTGELFRMPQTLAACLISGCKNFSRAQPIDNGRIRAIDWGADLTVGGQLPVGMTHIGVRAHCIHPANPVDTDNTFRCRVLRVVDDVFGVIVMLETPGGNCGYSLLRMELSKDDWKSLANPDELTGPEELTVCIAPSDVMPLTQET